MSDDPVTRVVDAAVDDIDAFLATIDASLGDVDGMVEPSPEELAGFFFEMQQLWPPMEFRYPDGRVVFASPWVLALGETANGNEWLKKFDRFIQRNGGAQ